MADINPHYAHHDSVEAMLEGECVPAAVLVPLAPELELLVKLDMAVLENYTRCAFILNVDWAAQIAQVRQIPDAQAAQ